MGIPITESTYYILLAVLKLVYEMNSYDKNKSDLLFFLIILLIIIIITFLVQVFKCKSKITSLKNE